jgi:RNA polymerase sigma-70 factor, ECF subfamily
MSAGPERNLTNGELDRLKARNPAEIRRVVDDLARPLYRAARGMGFTESDADDLVQEVFVTFMATLDRFEGRSRVSTWLFGILHNKAQERRRGLAREDTHDPIDERFEAAFDARGTWAAPPPDLERLVESRQLGEAIRGCLDGLPAPLREVFVLREMEDLDMADAGKILGRTVTHIGVQLHRARARLRACLESQGWKR